MDGFLVFQEDKYSTRVRRQVRRIEGLREEWCPLHPIPTNQNRRGSRSSPPSAPWYDGTALLFPQARQTIHSGPDCNSYESLGTTRISSDFDRIGAVNFIDLLSQRHKSLKSSPARGNRFETVLSTYGKACVPTMPNKKKSVKRVWEQGTDAAPMVIVVDLISHFTFQIRSRRFRARLKILF